MASVVNNTQKSKASQSRIKLSYRVPCEKCNRSFFSFRATFYHYVVMHNNEIEKTEPPTLQQCLTELEAKYEEFTREKHEF